MKGSKRRYRKEARKAHKYGTKETALPQLTEEAADVRGQLKDGPEEAMKVRAGFWKTYWQRDQDEGLELLLRHKELRRAILQQRGKPPKKISITELSFALGSWGKRRLGTESWDQRDMNLLREQGEEERTELLHHVECELAWPAQLLATIVALLAKPQGGERPIGLTVKIYRFWMKMRQAGHTRTAEGKGKHSKA